MDMEDHIAAAAVLLPAKHEKDEAVTRRPSSVKPLDFCHDHEHGSGENEIDKLDILSGDIERDITDLDVETVLQKQETHDLSCPNCKECITRRVILRKRKLRKPRISSAELTSNNVEISVFTPYASAQLFYQTEPGDDEDEENTTKPDIFRCFSCFGFFIPIGKDRVEGIEEERSSYLSRKVHSDRTRFDVFPESEPGEHPEFSGFVPYDQVQQVGDWILTEPGEAQYKRTFRIIEPGKDRTVRYTQIEGKQIEVIKSIVYGGLVESITSLSVVSSAAGAGAATLNIVALGMANYIAGLFIICHKLWEFHCDRYNLPGLRKTFILPAVVAILSHLVFGILPLAVYGFSFRQSDDKEFKLLAVAAASLLSILVLAVGKAYVQRLHYIKCTLNFFVLGIMASGVSYAAGTLFERLLGKLHFFEPSPVDI